MYIQLQSVELSTYKPSERTPLVAQQPKQSCCTLKVKLIAGALLLGSGLVAVWALLAKSSCGAGEKYVASPDDPHACICALVNSTLGPCSDDPSGLRP